jgi:O-antigen/teichoic acid export membrane protein
MIKRDNNRIWVKFIPSSVRHLLEEKVEFPAALNNSGWALLDKMLRALLGLLVGAWVARYLGPTQFGELAYCISFIAIFQSITNLGLDGIAIREVANHRHSPNILLGTIFKLRLTLGFICWVFALLIFAITNDVNGQGIWIVAIIGLGMIFQAADTVDLWFQGKSQSKRSVLAKAAAYLISNGVRVLLILTDAPLISFAVVIAIEGALTALALFISYRRFPCNSSWEKNHKKAKELLKESWPYMVSGLSIMFYIRIDQLMIKDILGEFELGIFVASIALSNVWTIVPLAICGGIAPLMARKKIEGNAAFDVAMIKLFRVFWLLCGFIIVFTFAFSRPLISLMYGPAYHSAVEVLEIYIFSCIPIFMGIGQGLWIINERKSHLPIIQTGVGALLSILTNLTLLPLWGIQGAALAAVMSQTVACIAINGIFAKKLFWMQIGVNSKRRYN